MRLEPLYRVRFTYPESWAVGRGPFRPDFRAVIEADDGAVIMVDTHGTAVRTRRSAGPDPVLDVAELIWEPIAE